VVNFSRAPKFVDFQQLLTQFPKAVKSPCLPLRFALFGRRREGFRYRLSIHLVSQTEIRTMAWLIGLMTAAVGLTATPADGGNRAAAEITQLQDLGEYS